MENRPLISVSMPAFNAEQYIAEAIESILVAIERAGYKPGKDIYLGLDAASNLF